MTVDVKTLEAGTTINIVYDTDALGSDTRVVVQGTCGFELASTVEDVFVTHNNIYSTLAAKPENNVRKYTYLLFKDSKGKLRAVADAWIRSIAIVSELKVNFTVTLTNRDEIDQLTKALAARGLNDVKYDIVDTTTPVS